MFRSEIKLLYISTIFPDLNSSKKNWTEAKLVNDLLTDYNPWARPRVDPREIVNVWFFMYLFLLNDVVSFYLTLINQKRCLFKTFVVCLKCH